MVIKQKPNFALRPLLAVADFFENRGAAAWNEQRRLYRIERIDSELASIDTRTAKTQKELAEATEKATKAQTQLNLAETRKRQLEGARAALDPIALGGPKTGAEEIAESMESAAKTLEEGNRKAGVKPSAENEPALPSAGEALDAVKRGVQTASHEKRAEGEVEMAKQEVVRKLQELSALVASLLQIIGKCTQELAKLEVQAEQLKNEREAHTEKVAPDAKLSPAQRKEEERKEKARVAGKAEASVTQKAADAFGALLKHPEASKARREAGKRLENVGKDFAVFTADALHQALVAAAMLEIAMKSQAGTNQELAREASRNIAAINTQADKALAQASQVELAGEALGAGTTLEAAEEKDKATKAAKAVAEETPVVLSEAGESFSMGGEDDISDQLHNEADERAAIEAEAESTTLNTEDDEARAKAADAEEEEDHKIGANPDADVDYEFRFGGS